MRYWQPNLEVEVDCPWTVARQAVTSKRCIPLADVPETCVAKTGRRLRRPGWSPEPGSSSEAAGESRGYALPL